MASYRYTIKNYHAIKEADIKLDGITVLSGVNGCGKSTLSRWLYYIINGALNYDINLFEEYKDKLYHILLNINFALRNTNKVDITPMNERFDVSKVYILADRLSNIKYINHSDIVKVKDLFLHTIYYIGINLNEFIFLLNPQRRERLLSYFDLMNTDDNKEYSDIFVKRYEMLANKLFSDLVYNKQYRSTDYFFKHIKSVYKSEYDYPKNLHLSEDNVDILDSERISNILNLNNVIYVDTPMSTIVADGENPFRDSLHEMMIVDNKNVLSIEAKKILRRIKDLMGGETYVEEDDILGDKTLKYKSSDNMVNIDLSNAATGFKTLAYLQRLLENGYLNENTLLMIDEPEAHLHPQWIVEFARLLVLLNKKLGLKIMLASHNPDMVAAIQAIAAGEGVSEYTNFYVAKQDAETPHQYVYKYLGTDVSEIFESFNIAIDSIRCYGNVCD